MPERASALQRPQIGVETTPGTVVAADKRLLALTSFSPGVQIDVANEDKPAGSKFPTFGVIGREWMQASFEGQLDYTNLAYLLCACLKNVAPTAEGTTGKKWTFNLDRYAHETVKTFTVAHGSAERAARFAHGIIPELSFRVTPQETTIAGSFLGKALEDAHTLEAAPTDVAVAVSHPAHWDLFVDDTSGAIGTTKVTRGFVAELQISEHWGPVFSIDSANARGPAAFVEKKPNVSLNLTLEADAAGMGHLSALRQAGVKFVRLLSTGPLIETGVNYKIQIDTAVRLGAPAEFAEADDVYVIPYSGMVNYDVGFGKALEIAVTNTLAAL